MRIARWLLAGVLGEMVMILWSFFEPPPLQQALGDAMLGIVPGRAFGFLIDSLQLAGKPLLYVALTVLQLGVGGLFALPLMTVRRAPPWVEILGGFALGGGCWAVAWRLFGGDVAQLRLAAGFISYGLAALAIGQLLRMAYSDETRPADGDRAALRRRGLLRWSAAAVGTGLAIGTGVVTARTLAGIGEIGMPTEVTPNSTFYVISKNFVDPALDAGRWSLAVTGDWVAHPYTLTYAELRRLPAVDEYVTLECISNPVGGNLISNARWTGVRLADLLHRAGVSPAAKFVQFTCADGYRESVDVTTALRAQTIVAYLMNGDALPRKHGYPARILTVGRYGMKNPKWLTAIEPVPSQPQGYWERQGWSTTAAVRTMSQIDVPAPQSTLRGAARFGGVAFAGDRGIRRVQLSVDDGRSWRDARLEPRLSAFAWSLWQCEIAVPARAFRARVRAVDGTGIAQPAAIAGSFPSGSGGLDTVAYGGARAARG